MMPRWVLLTVGLTMFFAGEAAILGAEALPEATIDKRFAVETLSELGERLDACVAGNREGKAGPCLHLVYVWSPTMPLSIRAVPEIIEACRSLGLALSILPAAGLQPPPRVDGNAHSTHASREQRLGMDLISAGATVHFPSLVLFRNGEPRGNAILGYKEARGYRALLEPRLDPDAPIPEPAPVGINHGPSSTMPEINTKVQWSKLLAIPLGAFFRSVPGTGFIAYEQKRKVFLEDYVTGEFLQGPGFVDFVPTPDGRMFVTPGPKNSGLKFYDAEDVFRQARTGTAAEAFQVASQDPEMADQYPSVGILSESADGHTVTYRVLVSWFKGLAFRDYTVTWNGGAQPKVQALTPKAAACPGMGLSIPIISRNGAEIAARDEVTGTTKIFRLQQDGSCNELFDIGRQTSKVGFSDDGILIAYSSPDADPGSKNTGQSVTYVLNRRKMETSMVGGSQSYSLVIPEFIGPDSLLLAILPEVGSPMMEFRLLCCVR